LKDRQKNCELRIANFEYKIISLAVFTLLFFLARYPLEERVPTHAFLKADPLVIGTIVFSTKQVAISLWPALAVVAATVMLGRFFCSHLCPLGTLIDLSDQRLRHPHAGMKPAGRLRYLKFYVLIGLAAGALAGWNGVFWVDPIALLTRVYALVLYPLTVMGVNLGLDAARPAAKAMGWVALSHAHFRQPLFYANIMAAIIAVAVLLAGRLGRRFWCRTICPLGALLGIFSRWALFRRTVGDGCIECGQCQRHCPMEAIGEDPRTFRWQECTLCRICGEVCPVEVISFEFVRHQTQSKQLEPWSPSRRMFLWGMTGGLALTFFHSTTPYGIRRSDAIIRPPGAVPEREFLRRCIRCGQCMRACLTNTLQPSLWEAGSEGIWAPRMDLRYAPCEQRCNVCGLVCPTNAIRALDLEERKHAKVGTAVISKDRCLVWERNRICLICDEVCPYNAIVFRSVDGVRRPFVVEEQCNGCGYCEHKCPVGGESAIIVTPMDEFRLSTGSYITEARRRSMRFEPDPGTDRFVIQKEGLIENSKSEIGNSKLLKQGQKPGLPKGFILEKP